MSLRGDIHLHQDDENNALFPFKLLPTASTSGEYNCKSTNNNTEDIEAHIQNILRTSHIP